MTRLLVSVVSAEEARVALSAGASLIDAKDPAAGALGALPPAVVSGIVAAVGDAAEVTAAGGDNATQADIEALAATGVTYVKVAIPAGDSGAARLVELGRALSARVRLVAVFAAEDGARVSDLVAVAGMAGFAGVMLDTTDKASSLLAALELADIAGFVAAARRAKLMVGLAGSLKVVDVGTLLPLKPDLLGFRGGVTDEGDRTGQLDGAKVRAIATALAVHGARLAAGA